MSDAAYHRARYRVLATLGLCVACGMVEPSLKSKCPMPGQRRESA
jgi:hypothetical protein